MNSIALTLLMLLPGQTHATLGTADLLKPPLNLKGEFTVAATAPRVEIVLFTDLPPAGKDELWSNWGDGCLASNGKYYTSIGNLGGIDGNSFIYEYDPETKKLQRVVDVAAVTKQNRGDYGHGKIHSGIHEGPEGWLYFSTFLGNPVELTTAFKKGFPGSLLLRYHPKTGKVENRGAIVPEQGLPTSHFDAQRGLLYFHAVDKGDIAVYDVAAWKLKFLGGKEESDGQRAFLSDNEGRVYFTAKDATFRYYAPDKNEIFPSKARLPGGGKGDDKDTLRAACRPTRQGTMFGMTAKGILFAMDPKTQELTDLGPNFASGDYTAAMVLSPDEKYLYFAPGAAGSSGRVGTPIVQYAIDTGKRKVLGFLNAPVRKELKYNLGGTYSLQIDAKGERLYFTFNGAPVKPETEKDETFGLPSVVVVHIPATER